MTRHRGFFVLEVIVGFILLTILSATLFVALHARNTIARRDADFLQAMDRAEQSLLLLQAGQPAPAGVTVQDEPAGWAAVTAQVGDQKCTLHGLVKGGAQ
jgi:hypothetical protein